MCAEHVKKSERSPLAAGERENPWKIRCSRTFEKRVIFFLVTWFFLAFLKIFEDGSLRATVLRQTHYVKIGRKHRVLISHTCSVSVGTKAVQDYSTLSELRFVLKIY
ncbi:hypothetical protein O6H91_Y555200 [Diphasiastrum complanatum]|nr:hypothetical protein O6H91_Y555200 [Diphasiastrum complanatum]